jgi:hypothetical protein
MTYSSHPFVDLTNVSQNSTHLQAVRSWPISLKKSSVARGEDR